MNAIAAVLITYSLTSPYSEADILARHNFAVENPDMGQTSDCSKGPSVSLHADATADSEETNPDDVEGFLEEAKTSDQDGIYHRADSAKISIPPELYNMKMTIEAEGISWIKNPEGFNITRDGWQTDATRIIYHDGKYHMWIIDMKHMVQSDEEYREKNRLSRILYMTSADGRDWEAVHRLPLGPEGSCYDREIEQANVLMHEGKFYLFSEGWTNNLDKYEGNFRAGIFVLVADSPEGPWVRPEGVDDLILRPENDGVSWDSLHVNNPRHIYHDGKWYMYYKGRRNKSEWTNNGLAVADDLLGPYKKHSGNPLLKGHGHFVWKYKNGYIMIPHYQDSLLWTEDGIHFATVLRHSPSVFAFGTLYSPTDPLFGVPRQSDEPAEYFGFHCEKITPEDVRPIDYDMHRVRIQLK